MIRVPTPAAAVAFVAGVAVLFVSGAVLLASALGEAGILAAEWLLLFLPALLFVRLGGHDPVATLSLRAPAPGALAGGVLLAAGALPLAWGLVWLQGFVLPAPEGMVEDLRALVTADSPGRLAWLLLLLAFTPAICEEVVFRGVLLSATRELATWRVLLLNGVVFGAFHLSFEAPLRFLPTAWLGIVITWAVLRSGSLWTGVLMHFLNNAAIVLAASLPGAVSAATDPSVPPPPWAVAAGAVALAAGLRLVDVSGAGADAPSGSGDPSGADAHLHRNGSP